MRLIPAVLFSLLLLSCGSLHLPRVAEKSPPASPMATLTASLQAAAGGGSASPVRLVENVSTSTYRVEGTTASEIRSFLDANGPVAMNDGRHYDSVTNWSLRWSFRFQSGAICRVADATVEIDVTTVIPELATPDKLSPDTLARWQRYLAALKLHEQGHADRELAGARDLKERIEEAEPAPTCTELDQQLNALGQQEVEKTKAADDQYDLETQHGNSQGAVFP